jgi:putative transposase
MTIFPADGVYLQARMEPQAESMLVLIGATPEGKKKLIRRLAGIRAGWNLARARSAIVRFSAIHVPRPCRKR